MAWSPGDHKLDLSESPNLALRNLTACEEGVESIKDIKSHLESRFVLF